MLWWSCSSLPLSVARLLRAEGSCPTQPLPLTFKRATSCRKILYMFQFGAAGHLAALCTMQELTWRSVSLPSIEQRKRPM